jgi:hypothetical protein
LLALSGWAIALLLWTYSDQIQHEHEALEQRLVPLAGRSAELRSADLATARRDADAAAEQRKVLEQRLRVEQSEQLMRASVLYELRNACAAAGVKACSVRLSDTSAVAGTSVEGSSRNVGAGGLAALGISRARAIVSGNLVADELEKLFAILGEQRDAVWRVNSFNVRNSSFELDVERHFIAPGATAGGSS